MLTLSPLGRSACPLRLLPHTASFACCLLCRRRTLCASTSSSRRRQRQGAAKVGPGAAAGAAGPPDFWQGSSPLTARCTHGLFIEHHCASHALLLVQPAPLLSRRTERVGGGQAGARAGQSGAGGGEKGGAGGSCDRPRLGGGSPCQRRRCGAAAAGNTRERCYEATCSQACRSCSFPCSSRRAAHAAVLQSSRRTKCTARPCRSTACALWRAWPPTTGGAQGAGWCVLATQRALQGATPLSSRESRRKLVWAGGAQATPPQRHRRRSALCLAVWRGLAQTCVLVSMLTGKRAVPRLLPLPRRCILRSHAASARNEAVQPKLRARRVGRELASCESDLPIR